MTLILNLDELVPIGNKTGVFSKLISLFENGEMIHRTETIGFSQKKRRGSYSFPGSPADKAYYLILNPGVREKIAVAGVLSDRATFLKSHHSCEAEYDAFRSRLEQQRITESLAETISSVENLLVSELKESAGDKVDSDCIMTFYTLEALGEWNEEPEWINGMKEPDPNIPPALEGTYFLSLWSDSEGQPQVQVKGPLPSIEKYVQGLQHGIEASEALAEYDSLMELSVSSKIADAFGGLALPFDDVVHKLTVWPENDDFANLKRRIATLKARINKATFPLYREDLRYGTGQFYYWGDTEVKSSVAVWTFRPLDEFLAMKECRNEKEIAKARKEYEEERVICGGKALASDVGEVLTKYGEFTSSNAVGYIYRYPSPAALALYERMIKCGVWPCCESVPIWIKDIEERKKNANARRNISKSGFYVARREEEEETGRKWYRVYSVECAPVEVADPKYNLWKERLSWGRNKIHTELLENNPDYQAMTNVERLDYLDEAIRKLDAESKREMRDIEIWYDKCLPSKYIFFNSVRPELGERWNGKKLMVSDFDPKNPDHVEIKKEAECAKAVKVPKESGPVPEYLDLADVEVPELPEALTKRIAGYRDLFQNRAKGAPKGLLLKGPPGTGKSMVGRYMGALLGGSFFNLSTSSLKKEYVGHSASAVRELWAKVKSTNETVVIFVDECELLFAKRGGDDDDTFIKEIVGEFLPKWQEAEPGRVIVIGATNRPELLDPAILSRFTEQFELPPPSKETRIKIIQNLFESKGIGHLIPLIDPEDLAELTQGKGGRDLENLVSTIVIEAAVNNRKATAEDFMTAIKGINKRSSSETNQNVSWDSLIVTDQLKKELKTTCSMLRKAEDYIAKGISVPRGMLLYGPPGTGKTLIASVMAKESGLSFIAASGEDLKGKYVGHTGPAVAAKFAEAKSKAPCILFIDEIEAVFPQRGAVNDSGYSADAVTTVLRLMDGVQGTSGAPVFVLAATNHLDAIDSAVLSRLPKKIKIDLPDIESRTKILKTLLTGKPHTFTDEEFTTIATATEGMSGRDLRSLVETAEMEAVADCDDDPDKLTLKLAYFVKSSDGES